MADQVCLRFLERHFPDLVRVGGTASALHAGHRISLDADHVLTDLRQSFDDVLSALEAMAGWQTRRRKRPVMILGKLEGGIRQLMRAKPLETETVLGIRVPTLREMLRIKAWLVVTRNKTRDYPDTCALVDQHGLAEAVEALDPLDDLCPQDTGETVTRQVAKQLAEPLPDDLEDLELSQYRALTAPWDSWGYVKDRCLRLSDALTDRRLR